MREEQGITLVALIITIVVLSILGTVSVITGRESIEATELEGFYTQMEIIQKRVDDIAETNETYIIKNSDGSETKVPLKEQGALLEDWQIALLEDALNLEEINVPTTNFKYFTILDLKEKLDISNITYNVYIDFDNRIVIAEGGITANGKTYYALNNPGYYVQEDLSKNVGDIEGLTCNNAIPYSKDKYKVTITQDNEIGDLSKGGYVKYKKTTTKYWETSATTEIILELNTEYHIKYIDINNNSFMEKIKVEFIEDEEGNEKLKVTEIIEDEEGNEKLEVTEMELEQEREEF